MPNGCRGNAIDSLNHYYQMALSSAKEGNEINSMAQICRKVCDTQMLNADMARDPVARQILTAWVVSRLDLSQQWLDLVSQSAVELKPLDYDNFAWIAYKSGQFDRAQQWLDRTTEHITAARWIQAKLFLRDGKIKEAMGYPAFAGQRLSSG